jgi:hypothetical protein
MVLSPFLYIAVDEAPFPEEPHCSSFVRLYMGGHEEGPVCHGECIFLRDPGKHAKRRVKNGCATLAPPATSDVAPWACGTTTPGERLPPKAVRSTPGGARAAPRVNDVSPQDT